MRFNGTGDLADTAVYTAPPTPYGTSVPTRYSFMLGWYASGHNATVNFQFKVNGTNYADGKASGSPYPFAVPDTLAGAHTFDVLLSDGDVLSFDVQSSGNNTYTWQADFYVCRMPEDLL